MGERPREDVLSAGLAYRGWMLAVIRGITRQDAAVALVVGVAQLAGTTLAAGHLLAPSSRPLDFGGYLLLGVGSALLLWRNRYPAEVLVAVLSVTLAYALFDYPRGPIYLALIVAFVHAVLHGKRAYAYPILLVGYLSFTLLVAEVTGRERPAVPVLIGIAAWLLVLLVGSELIRMHRAYFGERRRRAREAELAQEADKRRRASEERLEIARELHDVMAHSISLINVQAGVALELMDRRPEQARQALTAIKAASKDALLEVQSVLASLRGTGEPTGAGTGNGTGNGTGDGTGDGTGNGTGDGTAGQTRDRPSSPSLSALDQIVTRARLSGVAVHARVDGVPLQLPVGSDQAAARIVQEALTNVARHAAPAAAQLHVSYQRAAGRAEVVIVIDNDEPCESKPASIVPNIGGRGIPGMRERAEACGGTLEAGPRPGGFRVEARLPIGKENGRAT